MSEALDLTPPDGDDPDALTLSALLSSRVCHDLINPVGAIGSGLEVLDDPAMDGAMRDAAFDLIRSGATKAIALLSYARLAYGAAGGYGAEISLDDAKRALSDLFAVTKVDLDWRIGGGLAAKDKVKVLMIIAYAAADCAPRGGEVLITGDVDDFTISVSGKKILLNENLVRALKGDARDIAPKFTPALIAAQLVENSGGRLSAALADDVVTFRTNFGGAT